MIKKRKNYSAQEKVAILKRHLLDKVPVSDLCDQYGLHPTVFYRWQKELFENGANAFTPSKDPRQGKLERKVADLELKLARKHEVLSELMEEHISLKKSLGEI
jgi:transposase-like protein